MHAVISPRFIVCRSFPSPSSFDSRRQWGPVSKSWTGINCVWLKLVEHKRIEKVCLPVVKTSIAPLCWIMLCWIFGTVSLSIFECIRMYLVFLCHIMTSKSSHGLANNNDQSGWLGHLLGRTPFEGHFRISRGRMPTCCFMSSGLLLCRILVTFLIE